MRFTISLLLLCYFVSPNLNAQRKIEPSRELVTKTYDFSDYSRISVSDDFIVNLTVGSSEEMIELEVNENLLEYVDIENDGETLRIRRQGNTWINGRMTLNLTIKTGNTIEELRAGGDAKIWIENELSARDLSIRVSSDAQIRTDGMIKAENLDIQLASDAILEATIEADYVDFKAASDAKAKLAGKVRKMEANLASDGILNGENLTVEKLNIRLTSDAVAKITVTESLDASASSDATLRYAGQPSDVRINTSSDGSIKRM